MKIYKLEYEQYIPVSKEECWKFFSNPVNLERITPPDMNFEIKSELPDFVYAGQIIEYKIKLFPGVKASWITEITQVDDGNYFIDEQRFGPYKFWHHQHHFIPADGGILARDIVHYGLPFGFLGRIAHWLFVGRKLKKIFDYRTKVINEIFNETLLNKKTISV